MTTIELTYNRSKMSAIKEELKVLAEEIKKAKPAYKNEQRKAKGDYYTQMSYREAWKKEWELLSKISSLQFQFRHKLIAYSLTKGKKYEQIERTCREGNDPNWTFIKGLCDELTN
jgi:hypothetical protein